MFSLLVRRSCRQFAHGDIVRPRYSNKLTSFISNAMCGKNSSVLTRTFYNLCSKCNNQNPRIIRDTDRQCVTLAKTTSLWDRGVKMSTSSIAERECLDSLDRISFLRGKGSMLPRSHVVNDRCTPFTSTHAVDRCFPLVNRYFPSSSRGIYTSCQQHGVNVRGIPISTKHAADQFVRWMDEEERVHLKRALTDLEQELMLERKLSYFF